MCLKRTNPDNIITTGSMIMKNHTLPKPAGCFLGSRPFCVDRSGLPFDMNATTTAINVATIMPTRIAPGLDLRNSMSGMLG